MKLKKLKMEMKLSNDAAPPAHIERGMIRDPIGYVLELLGRSTHIKWILTSKQTCLTAISDTIVSGYDA